MTDFVHPVTRSHFHRQLRATENRLRADLERVRAELVHSGNKGSLAEQAFRTALGSYLPRKFAIGQGEVIDTHGSRSKQCDVVIATDAHPNWFVQSDPALFLIEAVAGAAEVKVSLTSDNLESSITAAAAFRALKPDWSGNAEVFGNPADIQRYYRNPPLFLFAYESSLSLEYIAHRVARSSVQGAPRQNDSLDGVFILDKGYVLDFGYGEGAFAPINSAGTRLTGYYWDDQGSPLLTLMSWLPLALAAPQSQIPVLAQYVLGDIAPVKIDPA